MFRRNKKRKIGTETDELSNMSFYDLIASCENKINEKFTELEKLKERGEVSEEKYLEIRKTLESVKRQLEDLRNFPQKSKNQNG